MIGGMTMNDDPTGPEENRRRLRARSALSLLEQHLKDARRHCSAGSFAEAADDLKELAVLVGPVIERLAVIQQEDSDEWVAGRGA
jgi:hypothetical protein